MDTESSLTRMLDESTPPVSPRSGERRRVLYGIVAHTRPRRQRHVRRVAGVTTGALLALGAGSVALAQTDWMLLSSDEPLEETVYTLPAGEACTGTVGNFAGVDAEAIAAAEEFVAREDLLESVDIESAVHDIEGIEWVDGIAPDQTALENYQDAVGRAVAVALYAHLESLGYSTQGMEFEAGFVCDESVVADG